jgi:hypothetical protein
MSVNESKPVRPNFWADRLSSYAFLVKATIGKNPMRYLMARRFNVGHPVRAVTTLFVLEPDVLFGTFVRIVEDVVGGSCVTHTFLPTMTRPRRVADEMLFDCLPLTDVGYLDLMAWPHPAAKTAWADPVGVLTTRTTRYGKTADRTAVLVTEVVDLDRAMVTGRTIHRDDRLTRTWEITEHGGVEDDSLPRCIRVTRPETGHVTEFFRANEAVPVPGELFDGEPETLRDWIVGH